MKLILILKGKEKNKFIFMKENKLDKHIFDFRYINNVLNAPILNLKGELINNKRINNKVIELLEYKFKEGDLIVLKDNSLTRDYVNEFIKKYNYKLFIINCDDKMNKCNLNNSSKNELLFIKNEYDFSKYKSINHIGDIHGCYTVLKDYIKKGLKKDEMYIFTGDYINKGIENVEVLKFLLQIYKYKNVILLEGNHDVNLMYWVENDIKKMKKIFLKHTKKQLDNSDITKQDIKDLYQNLKKGIIYKFNEKRVVVTHGGVSNIPDNILFVSKKALIEGTGINETQIDDVFSKNNKNTQNYSIHGHRNFYNINADKYSNSFNLEGGVEFGGFLRVCILDLAGFKFIYFKNNKTVLKRFVA